MVWITRVDGSGVSMRSIVVKTVATMVLAFGSGCPMVKARLDEARARAGRCQAGHSITAICLDAAMGI